MCGITGYTGPKQASRILVDGLKRLEYRGYDSAGIAVQTDPADQRALLLEVMTYAHRDGFSQISESGTQRLDGLFTGHFTFDSKEAKKQGLETLYQDKWLMGLSAAAFLVLFASFINDSQFRIKGIEPAGIFPV